MELRCARQWPGHGRPAFMITVGLRCWGLHPKSEIAGQASSASRRLAIEWAAQL